MTYQEFQNQVMRRRALGGEGYSAAVKSLLAYLYETRQITKVKKSEFERLAKHGH